MRRLLQHHGALRRAVVIAEQVACAGIIYTAAALAWRALGDGSHRPGVITVLAATAVVAAVLAVLGGGCDSSVMLTKGASSCSSITCGW